MASAEVYRVGSKNNNGLRMDICLISVEARNIGAASPVIYGYKKFQ